ncbi:endolytic transglycosylase MltG [Streptomyces oceani]|uniref:Endolytic murein transglycosylase n=1 Tax=Streptomyces oceani TaxID=1075402 RepID=A0A1E7JYJ7_9ACTN|nr:endolytic transglycosylase MltG [Streptomyces oceani]OEU96685.1 hypothetical protein AN216_18780 [Streptomyces oceani]
MTEYGRGPGSQPWHPEDPLYGDPGWDGGQPAAQQGGWEPYTGQQYEQSYDQQYQGYQYQQYPAHQDQGFAGSPDAYYQDPYQSSYQGQAFPGGGYQDQPYHDPHQQQAYQSGGHYHPAQQPYAGWEAQGGADPYGTGPQPHVYGTGQHPGYHSTGEPGQTARPGPAGPGGAGFPDPETGWDPGPDQGEHAFFAGGDDPDDGGADAEDGDDRRGRRGGKRRSGCACLVVTVLLAGGVGTLGYFGYQFYESRFGPAPDYSGNGSGTVQVEIPKGSSLSDMGNILKKSGVVKSHDAFVDAADENTKSAGIHAGVYTLQKQMSASAAIEMMLDPKSQSGLIVPEGLRATEIYELIDKKLEQKKGTTEKAAEAGGLGLPKWARGKPEGLLYPAKYTVGDNTTPKGLLRDMVERAESEYEKLGLESAAKKRDMTPRETVTVASLIQAEAQEDADFGKVARVIYNRLEKPMKLEFDSTINYAKGESKLNTTVEDTKFESPYNTYLHAGLPPGPIDNPGKQAMEAALEPTKGDWLFFVSVKPGDTRFTDNHDEHLRNVKAFNEYQREKRNSG